MERVFGFSRIPATAAPAPGATITVYDTGTANLSTLYADDLAAPTPKANPFLASASGFWFFYAAAGRYDIAISGGGIPVVDNYTLADVPAGLGDGPVVAFAYASLPATGTAHAGRLARVTDQQKGLWIDDGTGWAPVLDYAFRSLTFAGLPAAGLAGRIRRVTDQRQGLYIDDGAAWTPALAYALEAHAHASLPAAALAGRLRRQTDVQRGLWMDTGAAWFGLSGEVANVVEFGATRDGATDDLAAIQAAIDALATPGGVVYFPPGTYAVSGPIRVRTGITLRGSGPLTTIQNSAGFSGDSFVRAYRRDDNTLANADTIGVEGLGFTHTAPAAAFSAIDLTGTRSARICSVQITLTPAAGADDTAIRLADQNPSATSAKVCQYASIGHVFGTASRFLVQAQAVAGRTADNMIASFGFSGVVTGFSFAGVLAGDAALTLVGGHLAALGAGSVVYDLGAVTMPGKLAVLQCTLSGFTSNGDFGDGTYFSSTVGFGTSGTTLAAPLSVGSTLPQTFQGSCYVRVLSGTAFTAGVNAFVVTLPGLATGACVQVIPVSGLPGTPLTFQAASVGTSLTITAVAAAAFTLSTDFIFRLVRVGP